MTKSGWIKRGIVLVTFSVFFIAIVGTDAFARVGGGRSSGSRGSRPLSSPRPSSPSPSSQPSQSQKPLQQSAQPSQNPASPSPSPPPQMPSQGGFWRGLGGGILGGLIGGMFFSSLGFGHGYGGFGDSGIGLFEIVLIGALVFGIYWFFKKRRQEAAARAYDQSWTEAVEPYHTSYGPAYDQPQKAGGDLDKGLGYIRQMDSSFDEKKFQDLCMDHFFKIQGAWTSRDVTPVKDLLTEEMLKIIQGDTEKLRTEKRINRLENIAVRSVDMAEAWQESGQDFITVRFYANLLDFVENETTGQVVSGSKTDPVKFEEYWTFTRAVGNNPWKLSAIQQVE